MVSLDDDQYGFRPQKSTINACVNLFIERIGSVDRNEKVIGIFVILPKLLIVFRIDKLLNVLKDLNMN